MYALSLEYCRYHEDQDRWGECSGAIDLVDYDDYQVDDDEWESIEIFVCEAHVPTWRRIEYGE